MRKIGYVFLAVLLVAVVALAAGCDKAPEQMIEPDSSTASEPVTVTTFKPGVWNSDADVQYIFYEDGKGGKTVSTTDGMGVGFEYELAADGSCVFHMGSADQIDKATVDATLSTAKKAAQDATSQFKKLANQTKKRLLNYRKKQAKQPKKLMLMLAPVLMTG